MISSGHKTMFGHIMKILFLLFSSTISAVEIGRISNATFLFDSSFSFFNLTNRSCQQCLCEMSMNSTIFSAVSCQITGDSCQFLYANSTSQIQKNSSNVIFTFNTNWIRTNPSPQQVTWKFDEDFADSDRNFLGVPTNNPTFRSNGIDGRGKCLFFNGSAQQSVTVLAPPFLDMTYTSFTVTVWINANSFNNGTTLLDCDNSIFAQHDQSVSYRSLHLVIRRGKPYFGVYGSDTSSFTTLRLNRWIHLAFVYNYALRQQNIYINGVRNVYGVSRGPYLGTSGNLTIGSGVIAGPNNYFDGCLDRLTFHSYAKDATEILRDATLTVFYAFEENFDDGGPLENHGNGTNVFFASTGRVGKAANFSVTPSFVKTNFLIPISSANQSFTLTLWIYPRLTGESTLIQFSSERTDLVWTMPILGLTNSSYVITQICSTNSSTFLLGPLINTNSWTHLAVTFNPTGNLTLWINGTTFSSTTSFNFYSSFSSPIVVTIGSSNFSSSGQFVGLIDQFQIYSRLLSSSEIFTLANT